MIHFKDVSKSYTKEIFQKRPVALANLSFKLQQGQTLGLIGANGAGKSTCIRLLLDLIRPDKGLIELFDDKPGNHALRKKIGYLPETANFPPNLTVLDLLRFTGKTCDLPKGVLKANSKKWLSLLQLWDVRRRPLRNYSKGMQQRANFAVALLNDPDLLIFDEPMSGLDPMGRSSIIELIQNLKKSGKTILFCSHILEDVDRLVDNILLLHKGKKLFHGTPSDLAAEENTESMAEAFINKVNNEEKHG